MVNQKIIFLVIILISLGLRLLSSNQSLWLDEAAQANMSAMSLNSIWFDRSADFHPPLFYLLSHFWQLIANNETWLRLLPISFGVLNVVIIYYFAKLLLPHRHAGPVAALLLATNNFHIYYSQEYRSYSLLCLLGTISMYFFYRRKYLSLALVNSLLLYTHYASFFLFFAQFLILIFTSRSQLLRFGLSLAGSLLLYLPWLPQFLAQLQSGLDIDTFLPGWRQVLSISPLKALPLIVFKLVAGRINLQPPLLYFVYISFIILVTLLSALFSSRHKTLLYAWLFIPVFTMLLISFVLPQSQPFRVIYILPAFVLLFTQVCLRYPKLFLTIFIYIAIVGNFTYFTRPRLQREQWRQTLEFVTSQPAPLVLKFTGNFAPIDWYAPQLSTLPALTSFPARPDTLNPQFLSALPRFQRVYLLEYLTGLTDPDRFIDQTLKDRGWRLDRIYNFEGVGFLYAYDRINL